jgi:hypothetical protein
VKSGRVEAPVVRCRLFFVEDSDRESNNGSPKWMNIINLNNLTVDAEDEAAEAEAGPPQHTPLRRTLSLSRVRHSNQQIYHTESADVEPKSGRV